MKQPKSGFVVYLPIGYNELTRLFVVGVCTIRRAKQTRSTSRNEGVRARSVSVVGRARNRRKQLHSRLQGRLVQTRSTATFMLHIFSWTQYCSHNIDVLCSEENWCTLFMWLRIWKLLFEL